MGFFSLVGVFLLLICSLSMACDRCVHTSSAAYYSTASALSDFGSSHTSLAVLPIFALLLTSLYSSLKILVFCSLLSVGACGYGPLALDFSGGYVGAANSSLFREGIGCGGCFQIRCKNPRLCNSRGVKVVLTDHSSSKETGWVLSNKAFMAMSLPRMGLELKKLGTVHIEYKRIPCDYANRNLSVRVEESSQYPHYLAVKFLFQGGQTDIMSVDIAELGSPNWTFMTRNHGAVWETSRVPSGPLQFRFVVTAGYDGKWIWAKQSVLPAEWRPGSVYDSGVQIHDIAQEGCPQCDDSDWK